MWTASSISPPSYQLHHPLHPPPSSPLTLSWLQFFSSSGFAESQCLGRRSTWSRTAVRAPIKCSLDGRCYNTFYGRRALLFVSSTSFLLPPLSLAETSDGVNLSTIQNSLRAVLSKSKAAGMLRMAFHDAGTYDTEDHSGGMNGSILYELDRPENAGLNKSFKILEKAREVNKIHHVSWADLITVAGAEAVFLCGGPSIPIKIGRVDVRKADPVGKLPLETLDASGLKRCFQRKGFSFLLGVFSSGLGIFHLRPRIKQKCGQSGFCILPLLFKNCFLYLKNCCHHLLVSFIQWVIV